MVKTVLTPAHTYSFEALLDQPFAGTFNHATPNGQPQLFELLAQPDTEDTLGLFT